MKLRILATTAIALALTLPGVGAAFASDECFDLWYERNSIYDDNGYCFKTALAKEYFDNSDCWTKKPKFSKAEWKHILAIKEEEDDLGCDIS